MKNSLLFAATIAGGLALGHGARADLSYKQTVSSMMGAGVTTKMYFKGEKQRMEFSVMGTDTVSLTQCGGGASTQIDTKNKIYTINPTGMPILNTQQKGMVGNMSASIKVKNLGVATINGQSAPHWRVDMAMNVNGHQMQIANEIWSSKILYPTCANSLKDAQLRLSKSMPGMAGNFKFTGDVKTLAQVYRYVPLQMKTSMAGMGMGTMPMGTTNTTDVSGKTLPSSLFAVPAGYKKVSNAQFSQIQQKSMSAGMGSIFKHLPKMP